MKKLLFIAGLFLMFGMSNLFSQPDEITSIQRIIYQSIDLVVDAEENLNLEIVHMEYDLILGTDWNKTIYRTLSSSWDYVIFAQGEDDQVVDLDMKVYVKTEAGWDFVAEDLKVDAEPAVVVSPIEVRQYAIQLKVVEYKPGYSGTHYYLMIAHEKPE